MAKRDEYPGLLQAIWLVLAVILLQTALGVPVAILSAAVGAELAQHPVTLAGVNAVAIGLVLLWGLRRTGASFGEVFPLRPIRVSPLLPMTLATLGASIVLSELDNLFRLLLPAPPELLEFLQRLAGGQTSLWGSVLVLVVVAPITEELLFRGLILRGFLSRYPAGWAVLASALLFAVVHLNPWQFAGAAALGALFGWWLVATRSLVPCLFGHALSNALPVVAVGLLQVEIPGYTSDPTQPVQLQPLWFDALGVVVLGGGLGSLIGLFRRRVRAAGPAWLAAQWRRPRAHRDDQDRA